MTATNHALTGAVIGLSISNPLVAIPIAFLSHFVLDAIPHYDPPGSELQIISANRYPFQLLADASLCLLLVVCLFLTQPKSWLLAAVCAFVAVSPDIAWAPKFLYVKRTGKLPTSTNVFWRFHAWVQWYMSPKLLWVELIWFAAAVSILVVKL